MSKTFCYYQQGDCLIKPASIPTEAVSKGDRVLVEGEHTGHAHRVNSSSSAEVYILNEMTYLRTFKDTPIEHEEHNTIILPPGDYEIGQVKEYDHFKEESRAVAD